MFLQHQLLRLLFVLTHRLLRIFLPINPMNDRELLDILEELQNHEPCINDIRTSGTNDE